MAVAEGKKAPAFTLKDQHGNKVSLKDFAGKHVILYFYPRDNTSGCTKEAQGFRDLHTEFQQLNAVVVGVSPDSTESHERFARKHELPFLLLSDPDKKVLTKYEAFGEKNVCGRKTMGVIRSTVWIGPDGKVRKHWKKVRKAADHPAQVLEELKASLEADA